MFPLRWMSSKFLVNQLPIPVFSKNNTPNTTGGNTITKKKIVRTHKVKDQRKNKNTSNERISEKTDNVSFCSRIKTNKQPENIAPPKSFRNSCIEGVSLLFFLIN